jgi:hypothetical protein
MKKAELHNNFFYRQLLEAEYAHTDFGHTISKQAFALGIPLLDALPVTRTPAMRATPCAKGTRANRSMSALY